MIEIIYGNVGSGKTAVAVKDLVLNPSKRTTYSNILTKKIKNNIVINQSMLIKKTQIGQKKDGTPIHKMSFNKEFWQKISKKHPEGIHIILDEGHTLLNSRRSMSHQNRIMGDFLALLRRILGGTTTGVGTLTIISQLERRLDIILKEMSQNCKYCKCWYLKKCLKCGSTWQESSETPDPLYICNNCGHHKQVKFNHIIEVWCFSGNDEFINWKYYGKKTYYRHYIIDDIENYFPYYNTLQWDDLLTDV